MTMSQLRVLFSLAVSMMLLFLLCAPAQAATDLVLDPVDPAALAAGPVLDAGPDATDLDAPGVEINDPAPANSDCRIAPGSQTRKPLSALIVLAALFVVRRRRA